jgi:hypothetical protein
MEGDVGSIAFTVFTISTAILFSLTPSYYLFPIDVLQGNITLTNMRPSNKNGKHECHKKG